MRLNRLARAAAAAAVAAALVAGPAAAGGPRIETAFYNGQVVEFLQPAVFSAKPNGGIFACFGLGPDLTRADADLERCVELLRAYDDPDATVAEVLLDQRVFCGVGNVYRCEVLWSGELSPYAPIGSLPESDAVRLVNLAAKLLRANLHHAERITVPGVKGGLAVYGRSGQRCQRCSETIEARSLWVSAATTAISSGPSTVANLPIML